MKFKIGVVLSITYKKLLTGDMGDIYKMLNYLLDDNLYTHQIPRACRFVRGFVIAQHPQLEEWELYDEQINTDNWKKYLDMAEELFGKELELTPIPNSLWTYKDPIEELKEIVDPEKIMVIKKDKP